jgi:uncharacterized protein YecE (DUF72 family)
MPRVPLYSFSALRRPVIWTGTCGFGRRQTDVLQSLDTVEIQETFYRPVPVSRAAKWRALAPPGFRFAVKASQFITHDASSPTYRRAGRVIPIAERAGYGSFQDTPQVREGWDATRLVAEELGAEVIVFQTPVSFGPTDEHRTALFRFFESIRTESMKGLELRGPWAPHLVERICDELGLVHVVDPFDREPASYGLAYFRMHGSPPGPAMDRYTFSDADLDRLKATCKEYDDAYAMFNNVSMHSDAIRFRDLVRP